MQRVTRATAVAVMPAIPASPGTPGYFTGGDPVSNTPATVPGYEWHNGVQEELIAAISDANLTPSATVLTQLRQAIRRQAGGVATVLTVNTTLTADHAGLVVLNIAAARTFTLPAANALAGSPVRLEFVRIDATAFAATISRAGSDTIEGQTSITVPVGGRIVLVSDGVSVWRVAAQNTRGMQAFTANGNFTVPAGIFRLRCRVWGGGGGGGGTGAGGGGASGGAGGGYAEGWYDVTPGQVLAVTIGAGGTQGNGTPTNGGTGGTTSIGALLSATGGAGGQGVSGGAIGAVTTGVGTGTGGQVNLSGSVANAGVSLGGTTLGSSGGGTHCTSLVGGVSNGSGNSAGFPGGGGGGAGGGTTQNGAAGAAGYAIIEY